MPLNSEDYTDPFANPALTKDMMQILGDSQDAVLFFDRSWKLIYANRNARRISRLETEHIHASSRWELFPDALGLELECKYHRAMEDRVEERHDFFYAASGLWIESRIVPIVSGVALIYRDVTAEKEGEERGQAIRRQLEQVLAATNDAIIYLDREYRYTYINQKAAELLAPGGQLLGEVVWERFPATRYEGAPYVENFRLSMEQGLATQFDSYYPAPLNMWLRIESRPADSGIVVFFRDITQLRHDEEAMRQQRAEIDRHLSEIESLYRTAPVGLALFDPVEFRYLRLNDRQAEFFGLPQDQILGHLMTEMAPIAGLRELFEQVARGAPVRDLLVEGELITSPGQHRSWMVNYEPLFGPDGQVQAISSVALEVTEQKRAEAALIQSEKLAAVGRLSQSISHEINNPLESIHNLLYLISTDPDLSASTRGFLETAQGEMSRVSQIAAQTLNFQRSYANATMVGAEQLVGGVLELYRARLAASRITVEERLTSRCEVLCQENDIRQVLNNLIANAIDAMPSGGRLLVRASDVLHAVGNRPGIRITLADNGHGMSKATQKRIFEAFYTTKEMQGTGLGMWISQGIVAQHQGKLRFRSCEDSTHSGTVFSLFLPLKPGSTILSSDDPSVHQSSIIQASAA